ncbi:MAG: hypothetical protein Solivirus1_43 [Solivirus sp.]|uniref:Ankyrin repeat protein n=1 Tax=Solivirus sp. TaxID=2487772 RepID=A0A3G5AF92_9VIRU|nr:MAG: hypothetical protein Solivirus1_43 [Solivirus sp.]
MSLIFGKNTPDEVVIQLLVNADDNSFGDLCSRSELKPFCSGNNKLSERMYHERAIRQFSDLVQFKSAELTWKQFYDRVHVLVSINIETVEDAIHLANIYAKLPNSLMELNMIYSIYHVLPTTSGANHAAENGDMTTLLWLEQFGVRPDREGVNLAKRNGHEHILTYLANFGLRPTARRLF